MLECYKEWIAKKEIKNPGTGIFAQNDEKSRPMWDSGVRKAPARACKPKDGPKTDPRFDFPDSSQEAATVVSLDRIELLDRPAQTVQNRLRVCGKDRRTDEHCRGRRDHSC